MSQSERQHTYLSVPSSNGTHLRKACSATKILYVCVWMGVCVCMNVEGIPALLGSPPTCHKARGVNYVTWSGHYIPHDQYIVKRLPQNWWGLMWVSNHMLVMNSGRVSVTNSRSLYLNVKEEPDCREGEPQQACSGRFCRSCWGITRPNLAKGQRND